MSPDPLLVAPVVVPLVAGALLLVGARASPRAQAAASVLATLAFAAVAAALLAKASDGEVRTYLVGNWPAPFGIAFALDRLSALMLALLAVLALASLAHALAHWHARGPHFHALFQFQLMGLAGAFLTADLFNLFVFFEVLLIASYGLLLHAADGARTRAALHYVAVNLTGSALFLVAVGVLYGLTGTLNLADLALRVARLPPEDAALARSAGGILLVVFGVKAAALPLGLWLPRTYSAAAAPVAALFAILTKVGVYAILRVHTLVFGSQAWEPGGLAASWLGPVGLATLALGALGMLASRTVAGLAAYSVGASAGTLLAAFAYGGPTGAGALLFYLANSTLAAAMLFLLSESAGSPRVARAGALFLVACLATTGLPPLAGFVAKVQLLAAVEGPARAAFWAFLLASSFAMVVACARHGSRIFWRGEAAPATPGRAMPLLPAAFIAMAIVSLAVGAAPAQRYLAATGKQLAEPGPYIERILGERPVARSAGLP